MQYCVIILYIQFFYTATKCGIVSQKNISQIAFLIVFIILWDNAAWNLFWAVELLNFFFNFQNFIFIDWLKMLREDSDPSGYASGVFAWSGPRIHPLKYSYGISMALLQRQGRIQGGIWGSTPTHIFLKSHTVMIRNPSL